MHRYCIQLEELSETESAKAFTFQATNHDDLIAIVHRAQQGGIVGGEEDASVIVGLKLLSEVALKRRNEPLFALLLEPLGSFIRSLKSNPK